LAAILFGYVSGILFKVSFKSQAAIIITGTASLGFFVYAFKGTGVELLFSSVISIVAAGLFLVPESRQAGKRLFQKRGSYH
ncbi:MAG: hypothetical protein ACRD5H_12760, partial [Nitrososphaerales archaeon]